MKNTILYLFTGALIALVTSCDRNHFIPEKTYRKKVEERFAAQKELAKNREKQLFTVFEQDLTLQEEEALKFLYAYMTLSDLADYDGDFYLKNIRASLAARDTFSWGKIVPENLFRHFVLPVRVNNENLDSSRWVFFMDLKDRIKKMSMKEAVLEVNHWCHEKVTYRATDSRTSSPLATVKTAFGRCGEESTFTVAALRSVGIPARQCYTPRWAHCDDNHAWVEVWVDGKWHYLGACEPEPGLDMAWFTAPAKRAMLVNTNVFGDYEGPEDILLKDTRFTRINILPNYAKTKRIFVRVVNELKKPVDSAIVEFQLYNYAEFYPLYKTCTDPNGLCSFLTGYGDLLVWASKSGRYGYQKVTVRQSDSILLEINRKPGKEYTEIYDFVPPSEEKESATVSDSLRNTNAKHLAFEDKVRGNYESTFIDSSKTYRLAGNLKVNPDTLWFYLKASRGNWRELIDFISGCDETRRPWIFPLLSAISEKDLRDADPEVLNDQILNSWKFEPLSVKREILSKYILCPRVDNEGLRPYKGYFQSFFQKEWINQARKDPKEIMKWIKNNISVDEHSNYGRAPLSPVGSYEMKIADGHSRDILFVALCRSFGIPARVEPAGKVPQYLDHETWKDCYFEKPPTIENARGKLILATDPENSNKPEYYIQYTLEKFDDGFFRSLDYEYDPVVNQFPCTLEIVPGYYLVVTGNRKTDGTVLTKLSFFSVEPDRSGEITIQLRKEAAPAVPLGQLDLKNFVVDLNLRKPLLLGSGKGAVIAWLEPDKEPTKHFVQDLTLRKEKFDQWSGEVILLFQTEKDKADFLQSNHRLPKTMQCIAGNPAVMNEVSHALHKPVGMNLPLVLYVNPNGGILYLSEGYRIGIGDDLMRYINLK